MTKLRKHFELNQIDINHIELALTQRVGDLTRKVMETAEQATQDQTATPGQEPNRVPDSPARQQYLQEIESIRSLLGRLHGQKIWYEPKVYVPRG